MPNAQGKPTLGDLLDEIADDIERADLDRQIAFAVDRAIRHFQPERFTFNERILTFQTIPGVDVYGDGDAAEIPGLLAIDSAVRIENDQPYPLQRIAETAIERLDDPASTTQPCAYSYFDRSLRLGRCRRRHGRSVSRLTSSCRPRRRATRPRRGSTRHPI